MKEYKLLLYWPSAKFKVYGTLKRSYLSYIAIIHKAILVCYGGYLIPPGSFDASSRTSDRKSQEGYNFLY